MNKIFKRKDNKNLVREKCKLNPSPIMEPGQIWRKELKGFWSKDMEQPTVSHKII